uniref:(northern house mosquito) hypothetical protein n=1 Tax=Culex pipiens TaxID=7175 RepID=A0A8D8FZ53_CULPI
MWARLSGRRRADTEPRCLGCAHKSGKVICKERLFGCVTMKRRRRRVMDGRGVMNGNPRNLESDLERKWVATTVRLDGTNDLRISQRTLSTPPGVATRVLLWSAPSGHRPLSLCLCA